MSKKIRFAFAQSVLESYLSTALWSSTTYDESGNMGSPMDDVYDTSDFTVDARNAAAKELQDFLASNAADIDAAGLSFADAAHNFWLTRNGHGAGFWDLGLPGDLGRKLSDASKAYGSSDVMETGRGKVTLS